MFLSVNDVQGYALQATDGRLGTVRDVLFDDRSWALRYLVAETGGWLARRKVLLAPAAFGTPDSQRKEFPVALSRQQVADSPPIEADAPVGVQIEAQLTRYYGWPSIGGVDGPPAFGLVPMGAPIPMACHSGTRTEPAETGNPHLRSAREIIGYGLEATDGAAGTVDDFLIDTAGWAIRYMVIDAGAWLDGRRILLPPPWVQAFDWTARRVNADLSRERVETSPDYDPAMPLSRQDEVRLFEHYGARPYW